MLLVVVVVVVVGYPSGMYQWHVVAIFVTAAVEDWILLSFLFCVVVAVDILAVVLIAVAPVIAYPF